MPFVDIASRRINYIEQGAGVPVILVHSGGMTSRQWGRITTNLCADYRVIAPDLLGYGASSAVNESFTFPDDVEALQALIDAVGGRAHLVGHSYGGLVVLSAVRARPSVAISIAAYEPVAFGVLHCRNDVEGLASLNVAEAALSDEKNGGNEAWMEGFVDYWNAPGAWRALAPATRESFLAIGRKVYLEVRSLMGDRTSPEEWAVIEAPALFMSGARSPLAARRVVAILAESLPHARMEILETAGHMGPITHADKVRNLLRAHFEEASVV